MAATQDSGKYSYAIKKSGIRLNANEPLVVATGGTVTLPSTTTIGGSTVSALGVVTATSANALTVGPAGTTNPSFNVDTSGGVTDVTGININSNAAGSGIAVSVLSSGTNENLTLDAKGSGTITLNGIGTGNIITGATLAPAANKGITASSGTGIFDFSAASGTFKTSTGINTLGGATNINSTSATSLTVATAGSGLTNPAFQVDASTGSQAAGLKITGAATGGTVAAVAIDSGSNTNLSVNGKGSGTLLLGNVSTGQVSIGRGSVKPPIHSGTITALGTSQNVTPTAAQLVGGFITQTSATGAGTATLDNGTNISTAVPGVAVGDTFQCIYANLGGGQTVTITGATGSTVIGSAAVTSGKIAIMTFVNTGANAWNVYVNLSA